MSSPNLLWREKKRGKREQEKRKRRKWSSWRGGQVQIGGLIFVFFFFFHFYSLWRLKELKVPFFSCTGEVGGVTIVTLLSFPSPTALLCHHPFYFPPRSSRRLRNGTSRGAVTQEDRFGNEAEEEEDRTRGGRLEEERITPGLTVWEYTNAHFLFWFFFFFFLSGRWPLHFLCHVQHLIQTMWRQHFPGKDTFFKPCMCARS